METAKKVRDLAIILENETLALSKKCSAHAGMIAILSKELEKARKETILFQRRSKELEFENTKLKSEQVDCKEDIEDNQNGYHSGIEAVYIFPKEVWKMVFAQVKDPKDLKSCYEACTYFQFMLGRESTIFDSQVIKLVSACVKDFTKPKCLHGKNTESGLMNCRLVSQSWKAAADLVLEQEALTRSFRDILDEKGAAMRFGDQKNPWDDLTLRLWRSSDNPIPSRNVIYSERQVIEKEHLRKSLRDFLIKFGTYIWYFQANFNCNHGSLEKGKFLKLYTTLREWLNIMPNLKSVSIKGLNYLGRVDSEFARNIKLPTNISLDRVILHSVHPFIMESVLIANPNVKRLAFYRDLFDSPVFLTNPSSVKLKMLQEVCLDTFSTAVFCRDVQNVRWSTRKLSVYGELVEWKRLFDKLGNSFGGTLIELSLTLNGPCNDFGTKLLCLPNLKILNLEISKCFNSIDFILPLGNLEILQIDLTDMYRHKWTISKGYHPPPSTDFLEVIKFHELTSGWLETSNIWKLHPKLKKIMIKTDQNDYDEAGRRKQFWRNNRWKCITRPVQVKETC